MKYSKRMMEKGFSLLEALVGMVILAIGLMAAITMLDVSFSTGSLSKNTTTATGLAAYMLDRIRQDTILNTDVVFADEDKIVTFSNSASVDLQLDTDRDPPASEPGRTAFLEWQRLFQTANYSLPGGHGIVDITLEDPLNANNHTVKVRVEWRGLMPRGVTLQTTLARSL